MCPQKLFFLKKIKQELFNTHFAVVNHNGEDTWEVRLIEQTDKWTEGARSGSFLIFNLSSLSVILTHSIYCNRWKWHVHLWLYVLVMSRSLNTLDLYLETWLWPPLIWVEKLLHGGVDIWDYAETCTFNNCAYF